MLETMIKPRKIQQQSMRNSIYRNAARRNRRHLVRNIKRGFRDYCAGTTLHGFQYIVKPESTIIEGLLWFAVCVACLVLCFILMSRVWSNFQRNPTVTTIDTSNPIWEMTFPGVTICNNNKVYGPRAEILSAKLLSNGFTYADSEKFFNSLVKLIRPDYVEVNNSTAGQALKILGYSVDELMHELMQPCMSLLVRCAWLGQIFDCRRIFRAVKSKEGYCCAFNYHFDLPQQYGYDNYLMRNISIDNETIFFNETVEELPGIGKVQKAPGVGRDVGLAVALNVEPDTYKGSTRPYVGASVLIHDSIDYPDIGAQSATVRPGHVLAVSLSGTSTKTATDLRSLSLRQRMCLFDDEVPGDGDYSYQSCISECMYKRILSFCGCLPFYYPRKLDGVRTCYLTDVNCIMEHRKSLSSYHVSIMKKCNCLPQCNDKSYSIVSESVGMEDVGFNSEITRDLNVRNISFLYVYFGDITYLEYSKESIMSWDGLLASCGGIFGLCLGGSIISVAELLYYFGRHLFVNHERKRQATSSRPFPAASEMFLSVPVDGPTRKIPKDTSTYNDKSIFVLWSSSDLHQRGRYDNNISKNVTFKY